MDDEDKRVMAEHGITARTRHVFLYKEFKYDRLEDAVRYAKLDAKRSQQADAPS